MPGNEVDPDDGEQRGFIPRDLRSWIHPSELRLAAEQPADGSAGPSSAGSLEA